MNETSYERTVEMIPAKVNNATHLPLTSFRKRRVAGYARVSTDHDEQFTSYEAQVDYYTNYIKSNAQWEFVNVYTDEGISGLNTKHRNGFNQMIRDALDGKIDLILTKSLSRFARNTVDTLSTIRKLKDVGCECYFEKENIWTNDGSGELLITIMSSLAQEESRSISENVIWGQRKRFADGKLSLAYSSFLGYDKGPDKNHPLVINQKEAAVIRRIYSEFISGKTCFSIAKHLTLDGIPTPAGKEKWRPSTVDSILRNEKYKGAALLQKRYTVDFLTKKTKVNNGEIPQYYIEHSHEAIISPDEWDLVQLELQHRDAVGTHYSGNSILGSRIICGDCGNYYGPKTWNSTSKYRRTIWQCNCKFKNETKCSTPHFDEEDIKQRFLVAFNQLFSRREQLLDDCRIAIEHFQKNDAIDKKIESLTAEIQVVMELTKKCVAGMASGESSHTDRQAQYQEYDKRYNHLIDKINDLQKQKDDRLRKAQQSVVFMRELEKREIPVNKFDDLLWIASIDKVVANHDGTLMFCFKNGQKLTN